MSEENRERRSIREDIENLVEDVNKVVKVAVVSGSRAAESVGETVKGTVKETLDGVRSARDSVVMVRMNKESLERLDELVESGVVNSRSGAAAFLIAEGIKARQGLFDMISEKIDQIRKTKDELRKLIDEEEAEAGAEAGTEPGPSEPS